MDKAAAKLAEKHATPDPPATKLSFEQMLEYFALLTPEMWSHVSVYVYRVKPRIIRQLKDPNLPNYIDCLAQPFTLEYMVHHHGGGKFMFEVKDSARKSSHLFTAYLEVDEVRHEPKLNPEEIDITHRDNMAYIQLLQSRGILDSKGHTMNNQQTPASGLSADVIVKEVLGFVSKMNADQQAAFRTRISPDEDSLSKSVGQILVEKMKQDDPSKQVQTMATLITAVKDFAASNKPTENTNVLDRLIQMQAEYNKTVLELMKERTSQRPSNDDRPDDLDRFDKILGIVDRLQGFRGGGAGHRSGWDVGLDYARELAVPALQTLNNFMALKNGKPPTPLTTPGSAGTGAAFDPYRDQAALRAHAATLNHQPPGAPGGAAPPVIGNELMPVIQQYGSLVVNALNNGTPGYDFADYLCGLLGTGAHAMLSAQGEQTLVSTAMMVPELAMFGELRLKTFCHEFINYEKFLQDAENATATAEKAN